MNISKHHSDDKMDLYYKDISNPKAFEDKIYALYQKEFEDKLENILLYNEKEFMNSLTAGVYIDLEDLYSSYILGEQIVQDLIKKNERIVEETLYYSHYQILNKAWNDYVNKTNEFTCLSNYRKHCRYSKAFAKHTCEGDFIQVLEKGKTKYVICMECRKSYMHDSILMYCNKCDQKYYSAAIPEDENSNIQPATWDKYHCNSMKNEKMRCIKCREVFFYNISDNQLLCFSCKLKINPLEIFWNCLVCKEEFKTEARPFNPLEYKLCKQAIRQTLLLKQRARPYTVPCCNVSFYSTVFFHKAECNGELYQGEYDKKTIVVCAKCKTMNYYDKFLWTCPLCMKRFKQKVTEEEIKERTEKYRTSSHEKTPKPNFKEFASPDIKRTANRSITVKEDTNSFLISNARRLATPTDSSITTISTTTPYIDTESLTERKETKVRSLMDILEERKRINHAKAKNDTAVKVDYYKDNTYLRKFENDILTTETTTESKYDSSALNEFNKFSKLYKDHSHHRNESKIEVTQTSFNEGSNVVNVVKRYVTKEIVDGKTITHEEPKKEKVIIRYQSSGDFSKTPEIKLMKLGERQEGNRIIGQRYVNNGLLSVEPKPILQFTTNENVYNNSAQNFTQEKRVSLQQYYTNNETNLSITLKPLEDQIKQVTFDAKKLEKFDINDYTFIKQVGQGSYGVIYLVEDKMKNKFALKKVLANSTVELSTLKSEFKLVHEAQHPNIMKLYGMTSNKLDQTTFVLYILMELATNDWDYEIKQRLKDKKPYTEDELRSLLKQLINCLAWLQKKNISHRDLKPQNVLYFGNNNYKLADFGEAKEVKMNNKQYQLNTIRGTELYMSPILFNALRENKEDIPHDSYKSDVFSLGYCIIYAANLAFNCLHEIRELKTMEDISRVINKHFKNKYSQNIINVILKMVEIDENKRCDFIELEDYINTYL
jgi:hypothetical protein